MHRYHYNLFPCQNRLLQMQYDKAAYQRHMDGVRKARPKVDTSSPQTFIHLHLKPKKLQLEEERLAIIERDNRLLLEKMSTIMRKQSRVDNVNNYEPKSLNREKRQRELLKVTRDNKSMMERIISRSSMRQEREWEADWQRNLAYMDSISRYPTGWWEKEKTSMSLQSQNRGGSSRDGGRERTSKRSGGGGNSSNRSRGYDSGSFASTSKGDESEKSGENRSQADMQQQ
ncbi:hypothetical protein BOX15_Mlig023220g1 [Macrostomum lignano]|uniref:Uncharacterized protein n=2 Tax=Macrostomum lignano TaxID=282301 RepID=A0A267E5N5_9PLAT|nr:hypothetical protein BOX15_Mlig023220g1 [Macrostomum lignano]